MDNTSSENYLRIVSFNIRYDNAQDGDNRWLNRRDLVADVLRLHRPDIAGLQEALKHQVDDLAVRLPEFAWTGVGRDDGKEAGEYAPIFFDKARLGLLAQATFWLSETPDLPGSEAWEACTRIVSWAKFRDKRTRNTVFVFNTHFDHESQLARVESAHLLLARVKDIANGMPVVVTGDFNDDETSRTYQILTQEDQKGHDLILSDTKHLSRQEHYGPAATTNSKFQGCFRRKIDYIFVKNRVQVIRHGILSDNWDGRYPSDHLPVIAEVLI
ncbi:MAG: endonuclease/exonuclease/phosphatase family protein [Chloroflexota bacterium]|nr:endonuclease/exonuclease/phosphatase family protein [Chloroflexota bacterium]